MEYGLHNGMECRKSKKDLMILYVSTLAFFSFQGLFKQLQKDSCKENCVQSDVMFKDNTLSGRRYQ